MKECKCKPIDIKVKLLRYNAVAPFRTTEGSVAFDCAVTSIKFMDDGTVACGLGFATEIPETHYAEVFPRSSLSKYQYVMANSVGVIDSDYRGEWMAVFKPLRPGITFPYEVGDRCCQVIFKKKQCINIVHSDDLSSTQRGEGGFGSTGK